MQPFTHSTPFRPTSTTPILSLHQPREVTGDTAATPHFWKEVASCLQEGSAHWNPSSALLPWRLAKGHPTTDLWKVFQQSNKRPSTAKRWRSLFTQAMHRTAVRGSGSGCLCYFHPGKGCTDKMLRLCQCSNPATWPRLMILSAKKSLHLFMLYAKDRKINLMLTYKAHKTSFSLNIN